MSNVENQQRKKRILVFLTGGTICSTYNTREGEGRIKSSDSDIGTKLEAYFSSSDSEYADKVAFDRTENLGYFSENMTVENWNVLLRRFRSACSETKDGTPITLSQLSEIYDGIVIAHGTDTLAYSSAVFSLLLKWIGIPVFLVSSNEALERERANGNVNFRAAVECICKGIPQGVFVTYQNPSDGRTYLHYASQVTQCASYREDFYSAEMLDITDRDFDKILRFASRYEVGSNKALPNGKIINPLEPLTLVNDVLKIEPYIGLNYDCFDFSKCKYVLHGAYHSGTVCSCFYEEKTAMPPHDAADSSAQDSRIHTANSVQHLIDGCSDAPSVKGIVIAPAQGVGDLYDTVPVITDYVHRRKPRCFVRFAYGCTSEMYYAKLVIASSLGFTDDETDDFLTEKYCSEFVADVTRESALFSCEKTVKIYEKDGYRKEFSAKVVDCIPDKKGYKVVLNQSAFFPEGGGQKSDVGTLTCLSGENEVGGDVAEITDVQIENGVIYHLADKKFSVGSTVLGKIDWEKRFDRMQNHSGEHLLSGILYSRFGYHNVGFHLSDDIVTFDIDGKVTEEDVAEIERIANEAIYSNVPIKVYSYKFGELSEGDIRSKIVLNNRVRLVEIEGYDRCACCAPHVSRTGEIGVVKITSFYANRGGTRFEILCGKRAFADYSVKDKNSTRIMQLFSTKSKDVFEFVHNSYKELLSLQTEKLHLCEQLAFLNFVTETQNGILFGINDTFTCGYEELRYCGTRFLSEKDTCVLFSKVADGYIYFVIAKDSDARILTKQINEQLCGNGGGNRQYTQGKIKADATAIRAFFRSVS